MDSEDFKEYRQEQQQRRATRLPIRQKEIEALAELGYEVKKMTDYQYRINGGTWWSAEFGGVCKK